MGTGEDLWEEADGIYFDAAKRTANGYVQLHVSAERTVRAIEAECGDEGSIFDARVPVGAILSTVHTHSLQRLDALNATLIRIAEEGTTIPERKPGVKQRVKGYLGVGDPDE
jgi:hypothetical protein